jgi:hypothetical protein
MPKKSRWVDRHYQIYALVDPRDNIIRYVGISDDVAYRYHEHVSCIRTNRQEKSWMRELQGLGLSPILRILETIEKTGNERAVARERERYWIDEMLRLGYPLLNVFGNRKAYPQRRMPDNWSR